MKKQFLKSLIVMVLSLAICSVSSFAANTISIADGGISLDVYKDSSGNVDENYVKVTVEYEATQDESAEEMSRITFALSATEPADKLADNEAKVVYLDEAVTPTDDSTYSFVIEKTRIQSALGKETIEEIEGASLLFKMGGVGVEEAAVKEVVYNTPKDTLYGDVNGDSIVGIPDAVLILNHSVGNYEITADKLDAADINGDSIVGIPDAVVILNYAAGNITDEELANLRK